MIRILNVTFMLIHFFRGFHKAGGMMIQPAKKPGKMLLEWAFAMDVNVSKIVIYVFI